MPPDSGEAHAATTCCQQFQEVTSQLPAQQSRAELPPSACISFLLFCSIIVRPVLGVTGSRGHWGPSQLSRGVWGELHPGQSPLHHIQFYFDPFYYNRLILFVCIIEL